MTIVAVLSIIMLTYHVPKTKITQNTNEKIKLYIYKLKSNQPVF